jgi:hypothetical protein
MRVRMLTSPERLPDTTDLTEAAVAIPTWFRRLHLGAPGAWRFLFIGSGVLFGVVAGMSIDVGAWHLVLWTIGLGAALALFTTRVADRQDRNMVLIVVAFAFGLHILVALSLNAIAGTAGSGFITGDDAAYFRLSSQAATFLRGMPVDPNYSPPLWGGDAYLFGTFVYLETALFTIFGPDVRIVLLANAALAVQGAVIAYAIASRLFDRRAALASATIIAFYPSLLLWSSLNLKDALTGTLTLLAMWRLTTLRMSPRISTVLIVFAVAELLVGLRAYIAVVLAIVAAITIPLSSRWIHQRVAVAALTCLMALTIMAQASNRMGVDVTQVFGVLERTRAAMAVGAHTAFVPTATPAPTVGALPPAEPAQPILANSDQLRSFRGTLSYLPQGLAQVMFAPVPLMSTRAQELATAPEMVVWYLLLAAGVVSSWRNRYRWTALAPLILLVGGLTLVLALAEGNAGTLFRHRGMVVPFVVLLASPFVVAVIARGGQESERTAPLPALDGI